MAREDKQKLSGILGPVILKTKGKRLIVSSRIVAGTMKQTVATKKISSEFGVASKLSRYIRNMFKSEMGTFRDAQMHNRLTVEVHHSLMACRNNDTNVYELVEDSFESLNQVEHLIKSNLKRRLYRQPAISREGKMLRVKFDHYPEKPLVQFPGMSTRCRLTVSVGLFRLTEGLMISTPMTERVMVEKHSELNEDLEFVFNVPDGCLYIVSLFLRYYRASTLLDGKKWHAGGICCAMVTEGEFDDEVKRQWIKMFDFKFKSPD